ncbi:MAG: helix-turn-helix transcriptional regulator [Syntrophales bacterium]
MPAEMMNTKEVAKYLNINDKQVYALIREGGIPATRATGKWIFPKKLIDEWIETTARDGLSQARQKSAAVSGALLAAGSNDPILDILQTTLRRIHPDLYIFSANTGSTEGLAALNMGHTDIAWSHLWDQESGQYNTPFLASHLPRIDAVVVNLFHRDLGLIFAADNPLKIRNIEDLQQPGIRIVNRQKGSGTRLLFDYHLKKAGIGTDGIIGYENEVFTHLEVGLAILSHQADVGMATGSVSRMLGLSFLTVAKERFDMILDKKTYFEKSVQSFIDTIRSDAFRKGVDKLGYYDFCDSGKILHARN